MSMSCWLNRNIITVAYLLSCGRNPFREQVDTSKYEIVLKQNQEKKLREIIKFAKKNSVHYSKTLSFLSFKDIATVDINKIIHAIPYLEKNDLRTGVISNIKVPNIKGVIRETTGSTGIPVRVFVDKYTLASQLSSRWNFFSRHGITPGAVEGRFWGRPEYHKLSSSIKNFLLNRKCFSLDNSDLSNFNQELSILQNAKIDYFYGYSSLILKAAEIFDNRKTIRPKPKVIFTTAEMLSEAQRQYISDMFDCPVVQEYGCSEVDIIAFECSKKIYHLNSERLYVEFIPSETGNYEIVISDLDNKCMPIIRYRLGDLVEITDSSCDCGLPFAEIKRVIGRTSDQLVYLPDGSFFHAVKFAHLVERLYERGWLIKQYQVNHINPRKLLFNLNGDFNKLEKKKIATYLRNELIRITRNKIDVQINYCDINTDGKHKYYIKHF